MEFLNLSASDIEEMPDFSGTAYIHINLSYNKIKIIDQKKLPSTLKSLNISFNPLEQVPKLDLLSYRAYGCRPIKIVFLISGSDISSACANAKTSYEFNFLNEKVEIAKNKKKQGEKRFIARNPLNLEYSVSRQDGTVFGGRIHPLQFYYHEELDVVIENVEFLLHATVTAE